MNSDFKITIASEIKNSNRKNISIFEKQPIKISSYETIRWPYYVSLPFMWILTGYVALKKQIFKSLNLGSPEINSFFFDGIGLACRNVKKYAASWKAMEIIYNHKFPKKVYLGGVLDDFYWHGLNCQALRNRYKLVKEELRKMILAQKNTEVRLASLACGSAQNVIETIAEFKKKNVNIKALLIDIDADALKVAESYAQKLGVSEQIETSAGDLLSKIETLNAFKPQIIEMLGYLDYQSQSECIKFVKKLYNALDDNGQLITCNINRNIEQYFIKWVINWPMVYRNAHSLADIAQKSGFKSYEIVYEPLKIHAILLASK